MTHIDPKAHKVFIGEEPVAYSKLVLAWGADVIAPRVQGDAQERIFSNQRSAGLQRFRTAAEGKKAGADYGRRPDRL